MPVEPFFDEGGAQTLPLLVLFGVILAFFVAFLLITLYGRQLNLRVDEEAGRLVDEIAQAAFASLSGGQLILPLPPDVGGSPYTLELRDNCIFVVRVTGGRGAGNEYGAPVNAVVSVENGDFAPGGNLYLMRCGDVVILSAAPVEAGPAGPLIGTVSTSPPDFYHFAKRHPKEASALIAAYFCSFEDIVGYQWSDENSMLVRTDRSMFRVSGFRDSEKVGLIENSWVVSGVELFGEEPPEDGWEVCPGIEDAWKSGWLFSPSQSLQHLRGRTWCRVGDDAVVVVPSRATIRAVAVATNVSTYPAWKVEWVDDGHYKIYYRAMPWWEEENTAGFLFQSSPELRPVD